MKKQNLMNLQQVKLNILKKSKKYNEDTLKDQTISPINNKISKHLDRIRLIIFKTIKKEKIPFISTLSRNKIYRKT